MDTEKIAGVFDTQAEAFADFGAPFMAQLGRRAAADIRAEGPSLMLLQPWAEASRRQLFDEAVAIRFFGALHDLVLSGEAPDLAAHYPSDEQPGDAGAAWVAALREIPRQADRLAAFMTHEPQTNEVRRSAALLGGFLEAAKLSGVSTLRCLELGASAGLNQLWDRFAYDLGEGRRRWGDAASGVRIVSDWRGQGPDLSTPLTVVERAACDRRPVRLTDPLERRRLEAYLWPDQRSRLANLRAAMELALKDGVWVEQADAAEWAAERVAPKAGALTLVYHSIFFQYMPAQSQAALEAALAAHGASATAEAPLAWVRLEPDLADLKTNEVRLTLWPGGETRVLARSHPHATWVEWLA